MVPASPRTARVTRASTWSLYAHLVHLPESDSGLVAATSITVFFALLVRDSTVIDGAYLPRGNDSFYHARRILDAAVGSPRFLSVRRAPPGARRSLDSVAVGVRLSPGAKGAQVALWIAPTLDPMAFISYVPVAWIFVNAALFLAAGARDRLVTRDAAARDAVFRAVAADAAAALRSAWSTTTTSSTRSSCSTLARLALARARRRTLAAPSHLAVALGLAPAFHNGLFILQLVPLATVFVLWFRGAAPPPAALRGFAVALAGDDAARLLPSRAIPRLHVRVRPAVLVSPLHRRLHQRGARVHGVAAVLGANLGCSAQHACALAVPLAAQIADRGAGFLIGIILDPRPDRRGSQPVRVVHANPGPWPRRPTTAGLVLARTGAC